MEDFIKEFETREEIEEIYNYIINKHEEDKLYKIILDYLYQKYLNLNILVIFEIFLL